MANSIDTAKLDEEYLETLSDAELDKLINHLQDADNSNVSRETTVEGNDIDEDRLNDLSDDQLDALIVHLSSKNDSKQEVDEPSSFARFGRGVKSGLYKLGMGLENVGAKAYKSDPELGFSINDPEGEAHKDANLARETRHKKVHEKIKPLLSDDDILHSAGEWAGEAAALAPLGIAGKGAQLVIKGSKPIRGLSTKFVKTVAGSGALGAGNQKLKNEGVNPIVADVATLASPLGLSGIKRAGRTLAGYSPKKLNVDLYDRALKEGIELPYTVTSNSKIRSMWDNAAKYSPTASRQAEKRNEKLHRQLFKEITDVAEHIGPKKDASFKEQNMALYKDALAEAEGKTVNPTKAREKLKELAKAESTEGRSTAFERELARELNLLSPEREPTKLTSLHNRVKDTNDKIYDLSRGSNERRQQAALKKAYTEQFEDLAKSSPELAKWYDKYTKANKHHAKAQLRDEYEKLFSNNLLEEIPEHFDLRKAGKALKSNADVINDVVKHTPDQKDKLNLLKDIFSEIEKKGSKIKNPKHQHGLERAVSTLGMLLSPKAAALGSITHLINSNKLYKKALAAARQPTSVTINGLANELAKIEASILID